MESYDTECKGLTKNIQTMLKGCVALFYPQLVVRETAHRFLFIKQRSTTGEKAVCDGDKAEREQKNQKPIIVEHTEHLISETELILKNYFVAKDCVVCNYFGAKAETHL